MRYSTPYSYQSTNALANLSWPRSKRPTIQTSRGPQLCYASFDVPLSHRVFYTTNLSISSTQHSKETLIFADFKDKSRAGKGFDIVTRRGDENGPIIARTKFNRNKDFDITWENGRMTNVSRERSKWLATQDSHRIDTRQRRWGASPLPNFFWRSTWDYEASKHGSGNLELVGPDGKPYAVLVTVVHKSFSRIGTLHILVESMDNELLDLMMVTMLAMVKKIEKEGWEQGGGKSGDSGSSKFAETATDSITSSLITAAFGG